MCQLGKYETVVLTLIAVKVLVFYIAMYNVLFINYRSTGNES